MSRARVRRAGLATLLAAVVIGPLAVWGGSSLWNDDSEDAELRIETLPSPRGSTELVVSLPDDLNTLETSGGERSVTFECLASSGEVQFRVEHFFPFTDTDGGLQPPHVHQLVSSRQLAAVERCRLEGTSPPLEGPVAPAG